jgi:hypothetical protein
MSNSDILLFEFVTRIAYNIEGLSNELKWYFSQYLAFHFSKTLSISQIQNIENKKASQLYKNNDEIREAAMAFSVDDRIWSVASIQLLQTQAEKIDDRVVSRRIGQLFKDLVSICDLERELARIAEENKRIQNEIHRFQNRTVIKIPAKIWPMTLDYLFRWAMLLFFSYQGLDKTGLIYGFNIFFIPIFILLLAYFIGRRHKKKNKQLLDSYGDAQQFKIEYQFSTGQYTALAALLVTSIFISYLMPDRLHVLAIFGLTIYYFIYVRFFHVGRIKENDLVKQLEEKKINTAFLNVDENDEYIVWLETKLNSSTSRLEAYVLESALFGALTFSGFLQIMATDLVSFKDLESFASYIFSSSQALINLDANQLEAGFAGLSSKVSLFCLISLESLICSIFFLAVIASRLRFSDIADKVRTSINLAKAYNAKEEAFLEEKQADGKTKERLEVLTTKVNEQLHSATLVLEEINPVMEYMEYFRNGGILVFLVILISSSLFITGVLAWTFLALVLATYFYFNRVAISNKFKALFLNFRIQFIKMGYWLFGLALLPQILAYTLSIGFHIRTANALLTALSCLLTGIYVFAWLILAAHVDEQFGEIESVQNQSRQSRWKLVRNIMAVLILLFGFAMTLNALHLEGANEMILVSLSSMAFLMYFVGYYLTKIRWLGIFCGGVISTASVGILFKAMHWNGASVMILVAIYSFLILTPIVLWKRKLFHMLFIRFCVAGFLFGFWYSPFNFQIPTRLQLAYEHESMNVGRLLPLCNLDLSDNIRREGEKALDKRIRDADWYIKQYGTRFGFTLVYRALILNYEFFELDVLGKRTASQKIDSALLPLALKSVQAENKILKLFESDLPDIEDYEMEGNILIAMGKKDEALAALNRVLFLNIDEPSKTQIRKRIKEISKGD